MEGSLGLDQCGNDIVAELMPSCKFPLRLWVEFALIMIYCFSYMVDAADLEKIEASRNELHNLLDKPQLAGIPVLVLGNKRDLPHALDENGLIERM